MGTITGPSPNPIFAVYGFVTTPRPPPLKKKKKKKTLLAPETTFISWVKVAAAFLAAENACFGWASLTNCCHSLNLIKDSCKDTEEKKK